MIGIFCSAARGLTLAEHRMGASTILHKELLRSILSTSIAFFDTTPLGRILNRFSSDMLIIDENLSQTFSQLLNSYSQVIGALGAVVGSTKGTFMILLVPLIAMYSRVEKYFRKTNTAIARLESISRSPIYADFSQVLGGISSVRAYDSEVRFVEQLEARVDKNSTIAICQQLCSQWLSIRLDILGSLVTVFISALAASTGTSFIPASYVGLGLSFAFQLTQYLRFAVRMSAVNEAQMNSVERVQYYLNNVQPEETNMLNDMEDGNKYSCCPSVNLRDNLAAPTEIRSQEKIITPDDSWPQEGKIQAHNISMAYRGGPLVLKGVSFEFQGKEKVGIAGRTGSGKSSIMNGLFRIENLSEGSIIIDGIDIAHVPLRILRSRIGIIPQDPVMFSASVRYNLDPLDDHTDEEIWSALDEVNMKESVNSLPEKLNEAVTEGGENFSAGQRQLICIARVLLKQPRILVMDEATASIDNETDKMIQVMIRNKFNDSTLLTIAHRLHTIIDSDQIMVLDNGVAMEIDKPRNLLNKGGLFYELWERHKSTHNTSNNDLASLV